MRFMAERLVIDTFTETKLVNKGEIVKYEVRDSNLVFRMPRLENEVTMKLDPTTS